MATTMELDLSDFNIICALLGFVVSIHSLLALKIREKCYISDALISFLLGILLGPFLGLLGSLHLTQDNPNHTDRITSALSRLALGIQLVITGIQLPKRYLTHEWRPLAILLLPGLAAMWLSSSLIIWFILPSVPFLHALVIGACVSPTDPVLSNAIVKGTFADSHVPLTLRQIIIAESGANDGLGYPLLFLPLFLLQYLDPATGTVSAGMLQALQRWVGETWVYAILVSVVYAMVVGSTARFLVRRADIREYLDPESFTILAISLALFVLGTCGMFNSDDVLACFITGNIFTLDDWFRIRTIDDTLQPTTDLALNMVMFIWLGAVCPWSLFMNSSIVSFPRLVLLAVLILLFRRLPVVLLLRTWIPPIESLQDAFFMGYFGPIGVSAIFYYCLGMEFIENLADDDHILVGSLRETMRVVIWFLVTASIIVHGFSIPAAMLGRAIARWILSTSQETQPLMIL